VDGKTGCHSTRKTFGLRVYRDLDGRLLDVALALEHVDPKSTLHYLQPDEPKIRRVILEQSWDFGEAA
jgi:integrase